MITDLELCSLLHFNDKTFDINPWGEALVGSEEFREATIQLQLMGYLTVGFFPKVTPLGKSLMEELELDIETLKNKLSVDKFEGYTKKFSKG